MTLIAEPEYDVYPNIEIGTEPATDVDPPLHRLTVSWPSAFDETVTLRCILIREDGDGDIAITCDESEHGHGCFATELIGLRLGDLLRGLNITLEECRAALSK